MRIFLLSLNLVPWWVKWREESYVDKLVVDKSIRESQALVKSAIHT
jgi:hypothetical protein